MKFRRPSTISRGHAAGDPAAAKLGHRLKVVRVLRTRLRTVFAALVMIAVYVFDRPAGDQSTRLLLAWNAGAVLWLGLAFTMMARSDINRMRRRAEEQDEGAVGILIVCCAAAIASLVAIAFQLSDAQAAHGLAQGLSLALAGLTVLTSWLFVQAAFTLHYAHEYYNDDSGRGLHFPGVGERPDYWDFAYFAVNIGAASQTSDVEVTQSSLRRVVLAHSVLSFFFNTTVLALGINVAAGLL